MSTPAPQPQSVPLLSMTFEGNREVDSARLRALLRSLHEGAVFQPEVLNLELRSIERFYHDEGFLRATVGKPSVEFLELQGRGKGAAVLIPVFEGPRYTLASLQTRNIKALSPETFLQMSPLKAGDPYSRRKLSEWTDKVMEAYHALGHLRADLQLHESVDELRHAVECVLECSEGPVYRVGRIDVAGLDEAAARDFRQRILLTVDTPYNPEMLVLSLQLLNSMRLYRHMSLESVKIDIDDEAGTVRLEFRPVPLARRGTSFDD
ncbi:MAG: hypothetical protein HXY20_00660 [Acidobacteria bacterium]|nr:hypothetical protein [Acidobacteriota bacterium]